MLYFFILHFKIQYKKIQYKKIQYKKMQYKKIQYKKMEKYNNIDEISIINKIFDHLKLNSDDDDDNKIYVNIIDNAYIGELSDFELSCNAGKIGVLASDEDIANLLFYFLNIITLKEDQTFT